MAAMTCGHNVAVGAWCRYCGTTVDVDLVRAFAFVPPPARSPDRVLSIVPARDPDIELFEDGGNVTLGECPECHQGVLVSVEGWKRCGCGTQTTLLKATP